MTTETYRCGGYAVEGIWPQVGGGVRYLVSGPGGAEITVDEAQDGKLSGFVRGGRGGRGGRADEDELLRGAWGAVRAGLIQE